MARKRNRSGRPSSVAVGENPVAKAMYQLRQRQDLRVEAGKPSDDGAVVPHVFTFNSQAGLLGRVYVNPDEAIRNSRENARFMRNDLSVMECLEARQRAVALMPWSLETDNPRSEMEKSLCQSLTMLLKRIPRFTEYRRCLQEAIWYGRQGAQHNFTEKTIDGRKCVTLGKSSRFEAWYPINGDKLAFGADDGRVGIRVGYTYGIGEEFMDGGRMRRVQMTTDYGRVYFLDADEMERVSIHKHMIEDGAYEESVKAGSIHGVGIRSRIYWAWFQKQNTLQLLMEFLERSALGFEIWTYPSGNPQAERDTKQAAAERVAGGRNSVFIPRIPGMEDQYTYERIEPGLAGLNAIDDIVHRYFEWQIKRYILGQILSTEPEGGGLGSSGISDFQKSSLSNVLMYDADNLGETITTDLIRQLQWRNRTALPIGAEKVHVRFKINAEDDDTEKRMAAIKTAFEMGLPIRSETVYEILGIEKPMDGDETLQMQQPAGTEMEQPVGAGGMSA